MKKQKFENRKIQLFKKYLHILSSKIEMTKKKKKKESVNLKREQ